MISSEVGVSTMFARASAAASFMLSVIRFALISRAPLNIPGKPRTLLTWLGKSERPVAMILAPASFARSGIISGIGFERAKIIGCGFIEWIMSWFTMLG